MEYLTVENFLNLILFDAIADNRGWRWWVVPLTLNNWVIFIGV